MSSSKKEKLIYTQNLLIIGQNYIKFSGSELNFIV